MLSKWVLAAFATTSSNTNEWVTIRAEAGKLMRHRLITNQTRHLTTQFRLLALVKSRGLFETSVQRPDLDFDFGCIADLPIMTNQFVLLFEWSPQQGSDFVGGIRLSNSNSAGYSLKEQARFRIKTKSLTYPLICLRFLADNVSSLVLALLK